MSAPVDPRDALTGAIYAQVSQWLIANGWFGLGCEHRDALACMWREVAGKYGDESHPACGALLALVREAYGPGVDIQLMDGVLDDGKRASVVIVWRRGVAAGGVGRRKARRHRLGQYFGDHLGLALAAALMAAPRSEVGSAE